MWSPSSKHSPDDGNLRIPTRVRDQLAGAVRTAAATIGGVRAPHVRPQLSARARRRGAICAAATLALASAYIGWFRDSSFVRVQQVTIAGLATPDAARLRGELVAAGRRMTTLDVDEGALAAAVARDPLVRSVSAQGEFPSTLRVRVVLNVPIALLVASGPPLAVSSDGTLLPGARVGPLPSVHVRALPRGGRLSDSRARLLVAVAASAPAALRSHIEAIGAVSGKGLVARLRSGAAIVFGDASRLAAKWAVAAAVLAQGSSAGAAYVDVRRPEQPIAGGLTLADGPLVDAQPNPTDPAAPGVISAASGSGLTTGQPVQPALQSQAPMSTTNTRP